MILICYGSSEEGAGGINSLKKLLINLSIAKTSSKGGASGICMNYMKKTVDAIAAKVLQ